MTDSRQAARNGKADQRAQSQGRTPLVEPARIRLVYESADRRFCLFEDADGHLTSVRASKLA